METNASSASNNNHNNASNNLSNQQNTLPPASSLYPTASPSIMQHPLYQSLPGLSSASHLFPPPSSFASPYQMASAAVSLSASGPHHGSSSLHGPTYAYMSQLGLRAHPSTAPSSSSAPTANAQTSLSSLLSHHPHHPHHPHQLHSTLMHPPLGPHPRYPNVHKREEAVDLDASDEDEERPRYLSASTLTGSTSVPFEHHSNPSMSGGASSMSGGVGPWSRLRHGITTLTNNSMPNSAGSGIERGGVERNAQSSNVVPNLMKGENKKDRRRRHILDRISRLEQNTYELKERIYKDKSDTYRKELRKLMDGSHEGFRFRLLELNQERDDAFSKAEISKAYALQWIERNWKEEVARIEHEYQEEKQGLRDRMLKDIDERRKRLREEKEALDINSMMTTMNGSEPPHGLVISTGAGSGGVSGNGPGMVPQTRNLRRRAQGGDENSAHGGGDWMMMLLYEPSSAATVGLTNTVASSASVTASLFPGASGNSSTVSAPTTGSTLKAGKSNSYMASSSAVTLMPLNVKLNEKEREEDLQALLAAGAPTSTITTGRGRARKKQQQV